jgi:hypothetical protein
VLYALHASTLALAGRSEEAKTVVRRVLELEPTFRVGPFLEFAAFAEKNIRERVVDGCRQAGLPE